MNNLKLSGLLYFLAGAIVFMGSITAEAFYPAGWHIGLLVVIEKL